MNHSARILGLAVIASIAPALAHAAACSTAASGNWSDAATWNAPCDVAGGPTAADSVTIGATHSVVLTGAAAATSVSITGASSSVPSGGSNGLDLAGNNLSVSGAVAIAAPTSNGRSSILAVGGSTLTAGSISITGASNRTASMTLNGGSVAVSGDFTLAGTTAYAQFAATGASVITVDGNFTGGTRSLDAATVTVGGNFSGGTLTAGSSTVTLNGNGAQNVGAYTYNNLTINKPAGTATTTGTTTVGGTLNVAGGTLDVAGGTLTVTGPTSVSGTLTVSTTSGSKTFNGDVTIGATGTWQETAAEAFTFRGNFQNSGTFSPLGGTHTFAGAGKSFTGTISLPALAHSGSYTNNNTLTVTTTFSGSGTLTNGANATLNIGSSARPPPLDATASGNTVNYLRAGDQTLRAATYQHLVLKGSGTKTVPAITVNGDFTIAETATATASANSTYNGSFTIGANNAFNTGTRTITSNGSFINNGTLTKTSGTLNINGSYVNNGTLTLGTGTFAVGGTGAQTLGGSAPLSFYNFTVNKSDGSTVTLPQDLDVTNQLRLTAGTVTTGNNVLIRSRTCDGGIARTSGYVIGNLRITFPVTDNQVCTLHVGDARGYAPITVTKSGANSGTLTGRVDGGDHPDSAVDVGIDPAQNANHYWTLTTGTLPAATTYRAVFRFCATNTCQIGTDKELDPDATTGSFIVRKKVGSNWADATVGTKRAYSTEARNLSDSGTFVVGEKFTGAYDHIGIFLPASSSCLGSAAVTVKACLNSGCTSLYPGDVHVNLTTSGAAAWASPSPVTLPAGTLTLNLTDNSPETVTVDATGVSPMPGGSTQCYVGASVVSCTNALTFGACGFDAVEVGQSAGSAISMKRANNAFNLDVLSLSAISVTPSSIEIVDARTGTCETFGGLATAAGSFTFGPGDQRKTVAFPAASAASNARIRITYGTPAKVSCSSDNFSIRPGSFTLATNANGTRTFRAGAEDVTIWPTTNAGYNGTPRFNTDPAVETVKAPDPLAVGVVSGSVAFDWRDDGTGNLVLSGGLRYSEVGSFNLEPDAVIDTSFTDVDQNGGCVANTTSTVNADGCIIGSARLDNLSRFIPAFFETTVTAACRSATAFSYSGQPFTVRVRACSEGANNSCAATTLNYDGQRGGSRDTRLSNAGTETNFTNNVLAAADFVSGIGEREDVTYTFPTTTPIGATAPLTLTLRAVDTENVSSNGHETSAASLIRSGRLKFDNGTGSELLSLPLTVTAQYYRSADVGWVTNTDDACTTLRTSDPAAFTDNATAAPAPCRLYNSSLGTCTVPNAPPLTEAQQGILINNPVSPARAAQQMTVARSRPTLPANVLTRQLQQGVGRIVMTAPGVAGRVDATLLVPNHLRYNGQLPRATATFGIYKGVKSVIHIREQY